MQAHFRFFLEPKDTRLIALNKTLLVNRRYDCVSRKAEQTLQKILAAENMANADAIKSGVAIDDYRRACHWTIRNGLADDQINMRARFCVRPRCTITEPQESAGRNDQIVPQPRNRDVLSVMGRYFRALLGVQPSRS